jgi:hypothetical protein
MAEDRDFEPEAPAGKVKAAAKASKLSTSKPKAMPALIEDEPNPDLDASKNYHKNDQDPASDLVSGDAQEPDSFLSSSSVDSNSPPLSLRSKTTINGRARGRGSVHRNKTKTTRKTAPQKEAVELPAPASALDTLKRFCTPPNSPPEEPATTPILLAGSFAQDTAAEDEDSSATSGQLFDVRETSIQGDCLFDSIRAALRVREMHSDWTVLRTIPRNTLALRNALCDFAVQNRSVPLPFGHSPTVQGAVEEDYVEGGTPIRDPAYEACIAQGSPAPAPGRLGRFVEDFEDYVAAMRSPTANGDELMAALAAIYFGVRIVIVGSRQHPGADPHWAIQADYHPPSVHPSRYIMLVHTPGHYRWLHPTKDIFPHVNCGSISSRIRLCSTELFGCFNRVPSLGTEPAAARAGRQSQRYANAQVISDEAEQYLVAWPNPPSRDPSAWPNLPTLSQQQAPLFSNAVFAEYREDAEKLVTRASAANLSVSIFDAVAALRFTRNSAKGAADTDAAYALLAPGSCHNPVLLDTPVGTPAKGKMAQKNEVKRAIAECAVKFEASQKQKQCTCYHSPHCPCDDKASASEGDDKAEKVEANKQAGEVIQLKQIACEAIQSLTGCDARTAMATLERNLTTASMEQAITLCVHELHPAAKPLTFIEKNLGEGVRPLAVRETAAQLAQQQRAPADVDCITSTPVSELHPVNLNQRFLHSAAQHLSSRFRGSGYV